MVISDVLISFFKTSLFLRLAVFLVGKDVDANIAISVTRVRENAAVHQVPFDEELIRVVSHGLLHCLGFKDKTTTQQWT